MVDVKKLVVNFLVIATIASVVAFSLSGSLFGQKGVPQVALTPTAPPENAFLAKIENLPIALRENLSGRKTNLTEATAENLANVIVALNPTGPRTVGGKKGFVLPTSTVLTGYLLMENPQFKLTDLWSSPDAVHAVLSNEDGAAASQAYAQSFREIMKATISNPDFLAQLAQRAPLDANPNFASPIVPVFSEAIRKLGALPAPADLLEFHKNFLVYLQNERNVMATITDGPRDPLKSLVILNSGDVIGQRTAKDWVAAVDAYDHLDHKQLFSQSENSVWSTVASAFRSVADRTIFIPAASALSLGGLNPESKCGSNFISSLTSFFAGILNFFFKVPTTDSAAEKATGGGLSAALINCQSRILTQVAKANLVNIMNAKVLQYIQGANSQGGLGDPRFIMNFSNYFATAAVQGATKAYRDISPDVCPQFQRYVDRFVFNPKDITAGRVGSKDVYLSQDTIVDTSGINLGSPFGSPGINGVGTGCQLPNQVDMTAYYNDFNSDPNKWDDYFSLFTDPTNNPWGTIAAAHDSISITAGDYARAANAESIANQGNQADVRCTDAITLDDGNTICLDQQINKQGSVIASETDTAVNSAPNFIANADDLADIDTELADSLGNQLLDQPQRGLASLSFKTGNTLSGVCQSLNVPGLSSNPALSVCNNMIGKITAQFNKYLNILQNIQSILGLFL